MFMGSCANNLAALLADFLFYYRECLSHERERLEENSERRLEIFKELVNGYTKNPDEEEKFKDQSCSEQAGPLVFLLTFPLKLFWFLLIFMGWDPLSGLDRRIISRMFSKAVSSARR